MFRLTREKELLIRARGELLKAKFAPSETICSGVVRVNARSIALRTAYGKGDLRKRADCFGAAMPIPLWPNGSLGRFRARGCYRSIHMRTPHEAL